MEVYPLLVSRYPKDQPPTFAAVGESGFFAIFPSMPCRFVSMLIVPLYYSLSAAV